MTSLVDIKNQLLPGLMAVEGEYKDIPPEWKGLFTTKVSKMAQEKVLHTRFLGMAGVTKEGQAPLVDNNSGDRWVINMEAVEAGIMYGISQRAIEDGLYRTEFRPANLGLNQSMRAFWNQYAANVFNTASTYDANLGGDGKALLATDHPIDTGTYANTSSTPQALNETSLLAAYEAIFTGLYTEAGLKIDAEGETIIVPAHLSAVARRLKDAVLRPGSANNDPNVISGPSKVEAAANNIKVLRYLTSKYAWFVKTNIPGLTHIQRIPYATHMWIDEFTNTLLVKNRERAGFFCTNPRAIRGEMATQ